MKIFFVLNGKRTAADIPPEMPLSEFLRENRYLTSVKEGCGRGECGTCAVLLDGRPAAACLTACAKVEGREVTTLEGLNGDPAAERLKEAFVSSGAVQCGFCTPGMIISAYALLKSRSNPTREEIRTAISGNICRCTGYTKIIDAVEAAAGAGGGRR